MDIQQHALHAAMYIMHNWQAILGYSSVATFISVVLQYFKRRYKLDQKVVRIVRIIKLDGPRIVASLYTVGVAAGTAYTWVIDPTNAKYIPDRFAFILGFGWAIHRFLVSPIGLRIENALRPYWLAVEQIKKQQALKSAFPAATLATAPQLAQQSFNPANQQNQATQAAPAPPPAT